MHVATDVTAPWSQALGLQQHELVFYALVVAGLALFAQFVRTWVSTGEVAARYRGALYASLCICGVAFLSYVYLAVKFDAGYALREGSWVPNAEAINSYLPRYMDWSVTVPLLIVEALAVSGLAGAKARSTRFIGMAAAFLMIFTGYLGAGVIGVGRSSAAMLVWGLISTVFFAVLYVVLFRALGSARGAMGDGAYASYKNAIILLGAVFGWYPIAYAIHNWFSSNTATTIIQVGFSFADIAAKVGFAALIHKVAKLRTAEDVNAGLETHPEDVWVSSEKYSEALQPSVKGFGGEAWRGRHEAPRATVATGSSTDAGATGPGAHAV